MATAQRTTWAMHPAGAIAVSTPTNHSLNGTGIGLAWVVQAQTTNAITGIRFRYGARTGTPPSYVATIEGLTAGSRPDGTDKGGGSPTAKIFTPPASTAWDGLTQQVDFTNSYTPATKGEWIAFTIRHSSGTCDASNFGSFTRSHGGVYQGNPHIQGPMTLSGGSWTVPASGSNVAWITASETLGVCVQGEQDAFTANTVGHRQGQYFTIPATFASTIIVRGVSMVGKAEANKSLKVVLLDTADTVMATQTVETELFTAATSQRAILCYFDSPPTLTCGTKYRICLEQAEASARVGMNGYKFASTGDMTGMPLGANVGLAEWNGTTWTETNTTYPLCELILDDITVPSGGGAGSIVIGNSGSVIRGLI